MSVVDYLVLGVTMLGIAAYGMWRTRGARGLDDYIRGDRHTSWTTIGLSVMATQASAITFLSTPGQGYANGMGFVQNYFGLPLALIVISVVFLPIYRRLRVYTAYEYLGRRFDGRTRLLGAALFLLQRGLAAGITLYAPAIILTSVLGWRLDLTVLLTGMVVVAYTVSGGTAAVSLTQKYQMAVILAGMATVFGVLLSRLPPGVGLGDAMAVAGVLGKLEAVSVSFDLDQRYTLWSGLLGGFFLSLSYFGTDQSQVQRYLAGGSLRASRMGLMFNAVLKIPMQASILLLGVLVFVFYQFEKPPVYFDQTTWERAADGPSGAWLRELEAGHAAAHAAQAAELTAYLDARAAGDAAGQAAAANALRTAHDRSEAVRAEARRALLATDPRAPPQDSDYVFIRFVLDYLPVGAVGLLLAVIFSAALSSSAAELNALGATTTVDFYRHLWRPEAGEVELLRVSRWCTAAWGGVAIAFALFVNLVENLIEAVNILGSLFYGVVLGLFLTAFFLRSVGGPAVFWAALVAQAMVLVLFFTLNIGYLWYNLIGCAACVVGALVLQAMRGPDADQPEETQ